MQAGAVGIVSWRAVWRSCAEGVAPGKRSFREQPNLAEAPFGGPALLGQEAHSRQHRTENAGIVTSNDLSRSGGIGTILEGLAVIHRLPLR